MKKLLLIFLIPICTHKDGFVNEDLFNVLENWLQ